jgi:hypothetical protein
VFCIIRGRYGFDAPKSALTAPNLIKKDYTNPVKGKALMAVAIQNLTRYSLSAHREESEYALTFS